MQKARIAAAERRLELLEGEEILFEREHVVLTNLRLLTNWADGEARDVVAVKDVDGVRRIDGGQESRMDSGVKVLAVAVVLAAVQVPLDAFVISPLDLPTAVNIVNAILFVAWAVAGGVAAYLILTSLIRVKPHTSLLFVRFHGRDVRVSFPGRNNKDAVELRSAFEREKRAAPI